MATYYARNVTGNWASNTSWDSAASTGAGPAGPPVAGDTAIFDANFTGNITISAAAACLICRALSGATGTLAFGSQILTITGTSCEFTMVSTMTITGTTGGFTASGSTLSLSLGGATFPATITLSSSSKTVTLGSNVTATGTLSITTSVTFSGAYNISCANLSISSTGSLTITIPAGQTLTVSTSIKMMGGNWNLGSIVSGTASSAIYLVYQGAAANCQIAGMKFTDIDASGSAQGIDNWYGNILTRCTNITNRTSADFATPANAGKILHGTNISGIDGTLYASNIGTALGVGSNLSAGILKSGQIVDDVTGTYSPGGGGNIYSLLD